MDKEKDKPDTTGNKKRLSINAPKASVPGSKSQNAARQYASFDQGQSKSHSQSQGLVRRGTLTTLKSNQGNDQKIDQKKSTKAPGKQSVSKGQPMDLDKIYGPRGTIPTSGAILPQRKMETDKVRSYMEAGYTYEEMQYECNRKMKKESASVHSSHHHGTRYECGKRKHITENLIAFEDTNEKVKIYTEGESKKHDKPRKTTDSCATRPSSSKPRGTTSSKKSDHKRPAPIKPSMASRPSTKSGNQPCRIDLDDDEPECMKKLREENQLKHTTIRSTIDTILTNITDVGEDRINRNIRSTIDTILTNITDIGEDRINRNIRSTIDTLISNAHDIENNKQSIIDEISKKSPPKTPPSGTRPSTPKRKQEIIPHPPIKEIGTFPPGTHKPIKEKPVKPKEKGGGCCGSKKSSTDIKPSKPYKDQPIIFEEPKHKEEKKKTGKETKIPVPKVESKIPKVDLHKGKTIVDPKVDIPKTASFIKEMQTNVDKPVDIITTTTPAGPKPKKDTKPKVETASPKVSKPKVDPKATKLTKTGGPIVNIPKTTSFIKHLQTDIDKFSAAPKVSAPKKKVEAPKVETKAPKIDIPKVEAPKVDVSAPKVETKAPKIDIPKVDTPKVEVPIPKVETKAPKIEIPKVDTPKVEVPTPKVETKAPKIEIPKVEAPKVDVSAPKVETKAPKIDIPKVEGPKVEVPSPKIETKTPKIDIPKVDPKLDVSAPKVEAVAPKVSVPKIDPKLEVSTPKVETKAPKIDIPKVDPKIEVGAPKVEVGAPKVEAVAPKVSVPKVDPKVSVPKVEAKAPEVDLKGKVSVPKVETKAPKVDIPKVDVKSPDLKIPKVETKAPKVEMPKVDVKTPDVSVPKVETKAPKVDIPKVEAPIFEAPEIKGPKVETVAPKVDIPKFDDNYKVGSISPKLSVPKVETKAPKIDIPKIDPKIEVSAPKVEAKAPKIDIPKVETPKVEVSVPKVETKAPKIDIPKVDPKLEVSGPKIETKAPKIDIPKVDPKIKTGAPKVSIPKTAEFIKKLQTDVEKPTNLLSVPKVDTNIKAKAPKVDPKVDILVPKVDKKAKEEKPKVDTPKVSETKGKKVKTTESTETTGCCGKKAVKTEVKTLAEKPAKYKPSAAEHPDLKSKKSMVEPIIPKTSEFINKLQNDVEKTPKVGDIKSPEIIATVVPPKKVSIPKIVPPIIATPPRKSSTRCDMECKKGAELIEGILSGKEDIPLPKFKDRKVIEEITSGCTDACPMKRTLLDNESILTGITSISGKKSEVSAKSIPGVDLVSKSSQVGISVELPGKIPTKNSKGVCCTTAPPQLAAKCCAATQTDKHLTCPRMTQSSQTANVKHICSQMGGTFKPKPSTPTGSKPSIGAGCNSTRKIPQVYTKEVTSQMGGTICRSQSPPPPPSKPCATRSYFTPKEQKKCPSNSSARAKLASPEKCFTEKSCFAKTDTQSPSTCRFEQKCSEIHTKMGHTLPKCSNSCQEKCALPTSDQSTPCPNIGEDCPERCKAGRGRAGCSNLPGDCPVKCKTRCTLPGYSLENPPSRGIKLDTPLGGIVLTGSLEEGPKIPTVKTNLGGISLETPKPKVQTNLGGISLETPKPKVQTNLGGISLETPKPKATLGGISLEAPKATIGGANLETPVVFRGSKTISQGGRRRSSILKGATKTLENSGVGVDGNIISLETPTLGIKDVIGTGSIRNSLMSTGTKKTSSQRLGIGTSYYGRADQTICYEIPTMQSYRSILLQNQDKCRYAASSFGMETPARTLDPKFLPKGSSQRRASALSRDSVPLSIDLSDGDMDAEISHQSIRSKKALQKLNKKGSISSQKRNITKTFGVKSSAIRNRSTSSIKLSKTSLRSSGTKSKGKGIGSKGNSRSKIRAAKSISKSGSKSKGISSNTSLRDKNKTPTIQKGSRTTSKTRAATRSKTRDSKSLDRKRSKSRETIKKSRESISPTRSRDTSPVGSREKHSSKIRGKSNSKTNISKTKGSGSKLKKTSSHDSRSKTRRERGGHSPVHFQSSKIPKHPSLMGTPIIKKKKSDSKSSSKEKSQTQSQSPKSQRSNRSSIPKLGTREPSDDRLYYEYPLKPIATDESIKISEARGKDVQKAKGKYIYCRGFKEPNAFGLPQGAGYAPGSSLELGPYGKKDPGPAKKEDKNKLKEGKKLPAKKTSSGKSKVRKSEDSDEEDATSSEGKSKARKPKGKKKHDKKTGVNQKDSRMSTMTQTTTASQKTTATQKSNASQKTDSSQKSVAMTASEKMALIHIPKRYTMPEPKALHGLSPYHEKCIPEFPSPDRATGSNTSLISKPSVKSMKSARSMKSRRSTTAVSFKQDEGSDDSDNGSTKTKGSVKTKKSEMGSIKSKKSDGASIKTSKSTKSTKTQNSDEDSTTSSDGSTKTAHSGKVPVGPRKSNISSKRRSTKKPGRVSVKIPSGDGAKSPPSDRSSKVSSQKSSKSGTPVSNRSTSTKSQRPGRHSNNSSQKSGSRGSRPGTKEEKKRILPKGKVDSNDQKRTPRISYFGVNQFSDTSLHTKDDPEHFRDGVGIYKKKA